MNRLEGNKRSKQDFAQLSWWLSCYECNRDMVITRVVKSSQLPARITPTWLVSASYSTWHFSTNGVFEIKYPWTSRLLWPLSHLFQNFLTTLNFWLKFYFHSIKPHCLFKLVPSVLLISNMANCLTMYLQHEVSGFCLPTKQGVPHILLTTYSTNKRGKFILFWNPTTVFVNLNKIHVYVLTVFIPFSNT